MFILIFYSVQLTHSMMLYMFYKINGTNECNEKSFGLNHSVVKIFCLLRCVEIFFVHFVCHPV